MWLVNVHLLPYALRPLSLAGSLAAHGAKPAAQKAPCVRAPRYVCIRVSCRSSAEPPDRRGGDDGARMGTNLSTFASLASPRRPAGLKVGEISAHSPGRSTGRRDIQISYGASSRSLVGADARAMGLHAEVALRRRSAKQKQWHDTCRLISAPRKSHPAGRPCPEATRRAPFSQASG